MKTWLLAQLICVGAVGLLQADPVITFDDLPSSGSSVPAGYHGLNFTNFIYLDGVNYGLNPSGYKAGLVSSNFDIYGIGGTTATISAGNFDLVSAYATAAWNDNLQMEAKGYIKGTQVYDLITTLSATAPTLVNFNFYGVDTVTFTGTGGTHHTGYTGIGTELVLDNVNVNTHVPFLPALLTNGGFETGDFSGWEHFGNTNSTFVTTSASYVHSGTYGAQIGPVITNGILAQNIPTQIGELYSISFSVANYGAAPDYFNASWGSVPAQILVDRTNTPSFSWTNHQFNLLASRPSEFLEFQFRNDPTYYGFDDVTVTPALLVSNGGFETGNLSGWTPSGNSGSISAQGNPAYAHVGSFGVQAAPSGSLGFLSQNITTTPGMAYQLSFWLDHFDTQTPNEFLVQWNGATLFDQLNLPNTGWTNLQFTVVASGTSTPLKFGFRNDPSFFGLDEVTVTPVPLLKNGDFEFGDFTGWTINGNNQFCFVSTNSLYANSGFYGGQFGPVTNLAFFSQAMPTVPGQTYVINLVLDNPQPMTNAEFRVAWEETLLMDLTNLNLSGWLNYEFIVQAQKTNSTVTFGFRDDPSYLGLDGVFVAPIPQPVFQSIVKTNKNAILTWSAVPDYLYQVQYSTNLTKTNWTVLFNNPSFPGTIPMTQTDTNPPDTNRFYRVLMSPPPLIF